MTSRPMASPHSSQVVDELIVEQPPGYDSQRDFLRREMAHARWFASCLGAEHEEAAGWLEDGLSRYPLGLGKAMPDRRPELFWRALLGADLPGSGRMAVSAERHPVEELLAQLDSRARAAFLLRVWHDFDDDLLADLLGLRVGQVRVGLMNAFGLMRARLDEATDGSGEVGNGLRTFRARLAGLSAHLDAAGRAIDEQRLDRLLGVVDRGDEPPDAAAPTRDTALTSGMIDDQPQGDSRADPAPQRQQSSASWLPGPRTWLRRVLPALGLALVALGAWWFGGAADVAVDAPAAAPSATAAQARNRESPPARDTLPAREVEAVLASPDLPLLSGPLTPAQLAVMDQLRWWMSTQPAPADDSPASSLPAEGSAEDSVGGGPAADTALAFEQLDAADRRLLQGFATLWPRLEAEQRRILLDNARRWRGMDAARRARTVQRSQAFAEMPPSARTRARDSHALWQSLSRQEQDRLLRAFQAFSSLSPEQQQGVAEAFARLSPAERANWRFAEGERELLALAGRVFSFVPEDQRAQTLALLSALSEEDRNRLRRGTRRMSAWQREQLRQLLLAEPEQTRGDLLRRRFGG